MTNHKPPARNIHGIFLLNKPIGLSSNGALQRVKRLFQARKAGHTGSLDKLASGLLPICLGEATKLSGFLLDADKHYHAVCTLGITTTTGDAEGEILETHSCDGIQRSQIEQVLTQFTGEIQQIPPMHSAIKYHGQALYKLARQGQVVERQPRPVTIYSLKLQNFSDNLLSLAVHCSKGTYIRTLAEDIGQALGCGAHISALQRVGVGHYSDMIDLATLELTAPQGLAALDKLLLPLEDVLVGWPIITLSKETEYYIRQGQPVQIPHAPTEGLVKLMFNNRLLGIGEILEDGRLAPKRLLLRETE